MEQTHMTDKVLDTSKFLSAEALGITADERSALIEVMLGLECGELKHFRSGSKKGSFNMGYWEAYSAGCGTVGCIGGWVALLAGRGVNEASNHVNSATGKLRKLYYPDNEDKDWSDVTPKQVGS